MRVLIVDDGEITYDNPLGMDRTRDLEALLRSSGCVVPSFEDADTFSVDTYISQYALYRTETVFFLDRNLYSDALELLKGKPASESMRISAAVMAFASCVGAEIEPGIALYEGAASGARGGWKRDLSLFRAGDNINPINWAMIALGYSSKFTKRPNSAKDVTEAYPKFNPKANLKSFWFNYPVVLKLALLVRQGGDRNERMIAFLQWTYQFWQFSAPATVLAIEVFNRSPPKEAFKDIGSLDREKVLKGVSNAVWDMVYVQEWFKRMKSQTENNRLYAICSRDVLLQKVANRLRTAHLDYETSEQMLREAGFSKRVVKCYQDLSATLTSNDRCLVPWPSDFNEYRRSLLSDLRSGLV